MSQDRTGFIGGSDAAAILGVSPRMTPLKLYRKKIGELGEDEEDAELEKIFRRGKRLEPVAIDMMIEEHGVVVTKRSPPEARNYYAHPDYDFMRAEIDFEFLVTPEIVEACAGLIDPALIGTTQNGEIKTQRPGKAADKWGEMLTEEIPIDYAAQSMHGLMVTGRQFCLYGTLIGMDDLVLYGVRRDEDTISMLRAREIAFWNCVESRIPPDPVNMGDVLSLMYRIKGRPIEATGAIADTAGKLKQVNGSIKTMTEEAEALKLEIGQFIFYSLVELQKREPKVTLEDDTSLEFAGRTLLTWKQQSAARIDTKRLKEALPEVAAEFTKNTLSRVMRIK